MRNLDIHVNQVVVPMDRMLAQVVDELSSQTVTNFTEIVNVVGLKSSK